MGVGKSVNSNTKHLVAVRDAYILNIYFYQLPNIALSDEIQVY